LFSFFLLSALDEDTKEFMQAGASQVLSKPVQRAALEGVLSKYISGFQSTRSVAQAKIARDKNKGQQQQVGQQSQ